MDPTLPAPKTDPTSIGRIIAGKYRLDALLGHGGRGGVYRAHQIELARDVALKLITGVDEDARARFLQEARLAAEVRHPCVAEVFDAGVSEDGTPYCAMELLEGETLAARIARDGPMEPQQAVTVMAGVCSALSAVHGKRLVHRDVKPSNVFLARRADGGIDPKLIDFGIAKRVDLGPELVRRVSTARGLGAAHRTPAPTAPGVVLGTPLYLSPEQIMGEPLDARTDVHALGATLYEALSGEPPFVGGDTQDILTKILTEQPASLSQRAPGAGIPEALDREVLRALAKDPAERHASAADFAAALWTALASARSDSPLAPLPVVPMGRSPRSGLVAAVIALGVALLAVAWVRRAPHPPPPAPRIATTAATPAVAAPTPTEAPAASPAPAAPSAPAPTGPRAEPRGRAPRGQAPAPSAAPSATAFRIDDLKVPY